MSQYLIALGHNVPLGSLAPLVPQPATAGYQFTRRSVSIGGAVQDEAPFVEYLYRSLGWGSARYQALLTQTGLLVAKTALVTVYIQDENYDWVRMNGTIVKPQIGTDGSRANIFLSGFVFLVKKLQTVAS